MKDAKFNPLMVCSGDSTNWHLHFLLPQAFPKLRHSHILKLGPISNPVMAFEYSKWKEELHGPHCKSKARNKLSEGKHVESQARPKARPLNAKQSNLWMQGKNSWRKLTVLLREHINDKKTESQLKLPERIHHSRCINDTVTLEEVKIPTLTELLKNNTYCWDGNSFIGLDESK